MTEKSCETIWKEWQSLVNMAPAELQEWLKTDARRSVEDADDGESTGHQSGRRIVEIMRTNKGQLTDSQWEHMAKVVGDIKRHCAQGGPEKSLDTSPWRYSLMNWSHDPLKEDGCA